MPFIIGYSCIVVENSNCIETYTIAEIISQMSPTLLENLPDDATVLLSSM